MVRALASLLILYLLVSCNLTRARESICSCQTPEEALDFYLEALRLGDSGRLAAVYWDGGFDLSEPIDIQDYWILNRRVLTHDLYPSGISPLWSKAGTVQLDVRQSFPGGRNETFTYFFRKMDEAWVMVGHSSEGDTDDFVDDP